MPFAKLLVTTPFRGTQSEETRLCKLFQCVSDFRIPGLGKIKKKRETRERKRAGDFNIVWTGETPGYALLKSWLFSNHFMEQPHLPKITNIK